MVFNDLNVILKSFYSSFDIGIGMDVGSCLYKKRFRADC